jgi:IclR family KDG regulon transcriptional repressor
MPKQTTTDSFTSLEKALRILMAFEADRPALGVRELAASLGFSPSTVQRILGTLRDYSFVDQDSATRQYRLGNIYFQFVHVLRNTYPVTKAAEPFIKELLVRTQETVHLNMIQGMERICVESVESAQNLKGGMPIGEKSPLYAGASSKCLLAFSSNRFSEDYLNRVTLVSLTKDTIVETDRLRRELDRIRAQGYAASLGERTPGLGSLSAPILDRNSSLLAALSLAIPELRFKNQTHRKFCLECLLEIAANLSERMGYSSSR